MDEKFGERTILTRIHKIAEAVNEQEARGISIPDMAREILKHQQSRPTLTIDVAVYKSSDKGKKTGYIKQDGWVVIHPPDDDLDEKGDLTWHTNLAEAQETVRNAWGEVDEVLLSYLLQPAIVNVPSSDDDWSVGTDNLATSLRKLKDFAQSGMLNDTLFPIKYQSKDAFEADIKAHQEMQLDELNQAINTPGLIVLDEGVRHLRVVR